MFMTAFAALLSFLLPAGAEPYLQSDSIYAEVERVDVATKYAGRVSEIRVEEGDVVALDQLIAQLDVTELKAQLAAANLNAKVAHRGWTQRRGHYQYRIDLQVDGWPGDEPGSEADRIGVPGSLRSVSFSGDGQRIVVSATPTPLIDDDYVARSLYVLDREGNVLRSIAPQRKIGTIRPNHDGSEVLLIGAADPNDPAAGRLMRWQGDALVEERCYKPAFELDKALG